MCMVQRSPGRRTPKGVLNWESLLSNKIRIVPPSYRFQILSAYSRTARSEEKIPAFAVSLAFLFGKREKYHYM